MVCPKCSFQLPEGASFCPRCGASIATKTRCPKCQSVIDSSSVFCPKCGARIAGNASVSPVSARPTPTPAPAPTPAPTPPAKKRVFTFKNFLIVLVVGIVMRGVGYMMGSTWSSGSKSTSSVPSVGTNISPNLGAGVKLKNDIDTNALLTSNDYTVSLVSAIVYEDDDGNPLLVVKYSFANNSSENQSFSSATYDKAFQNSVQLAPAYFSSSQYDASLAIKEVQPGGKLDVERAYSLDDKTSDVEVEVVTHGLNSTTLLQMTILLPG